MAKRLAQISEYLPVAPTPSVCPQLPPPLFHPGETGMEGKLAPPCLRATAPVIAPLLVYQNYRRQNRDDRGLLANLNKKSSIRINDILDTPSKPVEGVVASI